MFLNKQHLTMARTFSMAIIATLGLASCATYDRRVCGNQLAPRSTRHAGAGRGRAPNPPASPHSRPTNGWIK